MLCTRRARGLHWVKQMATCRCHHVELAKQIAKCSTSLTSSESAGESNGPSVSLLSQCHSYSSVLSKKCNTSHMSFVILQLSLPSFCAVGQQSHAKEKIPLGAFFFKLSLAETCFLATFCLQSHLSGFEWKEWLSGKQALRCSARNFCCLSQPSCAFKLTMHTFFWNLCVTHAFTHILSDAQRL